MYKIEELIKKANEVHHGKYSYDESTYIKTTEKMRIICPKHGEFWQSLHQHINKKQGCPYCGKEIKKNRSGIISKSITAEDFFLKCKEKFGDKFIYDGKYKNLNSKIHIICPEHGEFMQTANVHLNSKTGCPKCSWQMISEQYTNNTKDFIKKAKKVHNNKYDYTKTDYINATTPIQIICPIHGEFTQLPYNHLSGNGCPVCGVKKTAEFNTLSKDEFIKRATIIHKGKYDYSKVVYKKYLEKVCIICPKHGEFWQTPDDHLQGKGCRKCGNLLSKAENEIYNFCCNILDKNSIIQSDRSLLGKLELDIYIPSLHIAIEYNGLHWHTENMGKDRRYHLNKMLECNKKGVSLIQIFEDEYLFHKDIVLNKIEHILHKQNLPKIMGRKCNIKEIDKNTAKSFFEEFHIQGYSRSTVYLGAYYNEELIAAMSFKKENSGNWELSRFASNYHYICQGIGGKLFSYFINNYNPNKIKSFADRRWTIDEDNLYTKIGFKKERYLEPDYHYVNDSKLPTRYHKFNFRKQKLHKKYGLPLSMTEKEMTEQLGYTKIWDCGLIKYVWKQKREP